MRLKKMCTALLSGIIAFGAMAVPLPNGTGLFSIKNIAVTAEAASAMRRPCDPDHPMLIVHIDTWNTADPAKIIATIPEDIKPYCVFNISMSINWSNDKHEWLMTQDGYELAKSWLKTCSDEGVWCMVQPASGGQCHFPDYDSSGNIVNFPNKGEFTAHADDDYENTIYAEFFRDYPGFIGFNYSEQFWGFESSDFPVTPIQRYQHFAKLLKLCNKYGGYLNINWCANQWSAPLNPVAMLKRCPEWKTACEQYSDNLQLEEKYTQGSFIEDVESEVLGAYLSGYCGNFGVRYDETGWTDRSEADKPLSTKDQYRPITGLPIHAERMLLNGATIIDGPELIWSDDFGETWGGVKDSEGYSCRNWYTKDQYVNPTLNFFSKIADGTYRIPTRQEVIDRTQFVVIQDNSSGDDHNKYSTYATLFEGLYRMPGDGNLKDNTNLFKSTGRYPTIPTVYVLKDDTAKTFKYQLKQSQLPSRWSTISAKQDEFNKVFSSDAASNCYVGRYNNTWVTYNNNKNGANCGGLLDLKYNTCKTLDVNFNAYGNAIINEYSDHIDIYTNNFDNKAQTTLKTDTFKVNGCSSKPIYTATDTGRNQAQSEITESYSNGTYTLTVKHNGPVDITINCSGNETGRASNYNIASVKSIAQPSFYTGTRQYEGEFFDIKNAEGYVQNACGSGVTGIQGQGFLKFGQNASAAAKDTVKTQKAGEFKLNLRYSSTSDINNVDMYVNGSKVETMKLSNTNGYSNWKNYSKNITLKEGENKIEFKANAALPSSLYIDNFTVDGDFGEGGQTGDPEPINGKLIKNLVVKDKENASDCSIGYDFGEGSTVYGDRTFVCTSSCGFADGTEYIKTACDSKLCTDDLAEFEAAEDMYVYVAIDNRIPADAVPWLSSWTKTNASISVSNDVIFTLFQKQVKSGEKVTLGTNGGLGESANYIVFASASLPIVKGDVNADGIFNIADAVLLQKWILAVPNNVLTDWKAGDLCGDNRLNSLDLSIMRKMLIETTSRMTPDEYMAQVASKVVEFEANGAVDEKSDTQYGTFEKVTFTSAVCGGRSKSFNVLLPANYDKNKKYPVLYTLHGYWGDEDALLDKGDASLKLRQIIGNAIADGEAEEMIVVFPDIYASDSQDKCDGLNDKNNKAYDNFINELTKEIMPYMEQNYSVKTGRDNTAITGFSMGGRESLYIGFSRPDLFGYVGAMCPAPGLTTDLIKEDDLKFNGQSPYLLMVSAGSNDQIVWSTPSGYHDTMNKNGTTHIWHYVTDGDHGGKTIRPHMYNFVRNIFKA